MGLEPTDPRFTELMRAVRAAFTDPPALDFEHIREGMPRMRYDFPFINVDRRPSGSLTSEISRFHDDATGKFYYYDFWDKQQEAILTWPNEKLTHASSGYHVRAEVAKFDDDVVNSSKQTAETWFRDEVIGRIADARARLCFFLLGQPGAGKSTLLKYLINSQRDACREADVVVTRFETVKFRDLLDSRLTKQEAGPVYAEKFVVAMDDYVHTIVLRDLLFNEAYCLSNEGLVPRRNHKLFTSEGVEEFSYLASDMPLPGGEILIQSEEESEAVRQSAFRILREAIRDRKSGPHDMMLDYRLLFSLDPTIRRKMVVLLAQRKRICIVFDGLDFLTPDDSDMDPQKYRVLTLVMRLFGFGLEQMAGRPLTLGFDVHAIIPLRPNTYWELHDRSAPPDPKIGRSSIIERRIIELPARVVLYRAIVRGLRSNRLFRDKKNEEISEAADNFFGFIDRAMRVVGVQFGMEHGTPDVLSLFNGNLRDCFDLLARVLFWMREEGRSTGVPAGASLPDLMNFAATEAAGQLLGHRGYRLVEHMLFFATSTFQNALEIDRFPSESKLVPGGHDIKQNRTCRGLIDNIFNYHSLDHDNYHSGHKLLQKLRILQILTHRSTVSTDAIKSAMEGFGYDIDPTSDLDVALKILRYVGFIMPIAEAGRTSYKITPKGRNVTTGLIYKSTYLEHVFHKSLLPLVLIEQIQDQPRVEGGDAANKSINEWAVNSIRNYFILLSYIKSIESYKTGDRSVPEIHRIWPAMRKSVLRTVERILFSDFRGKRYHDPGTWFATRVSDSIAALNAKWVNKGIIVLRLGQDATVSADHRLGSA